MGHEDKGPFYPSPMSAPVPKPAGFLILDKPVGPSSMRAVAVVRRRAGNLKTGHGGTLDPLASGVLVLGLGKATKLLERVVATRKGYVTDIDLSLRTTTDDLEGDPLPITVAAEPTATEVEEALACFEGDIMQRPPNFSAIKVGGRRAYALARQDKPVDLPARPIHVSMLALRSFEWPIARVEITCDKGFYVRSLARDLGLALGTGGCCRSIRRTAVGPFTLAEAIPLDDVPDPMPETSLIPVHTALARIGSDT